MRRLRSLVERVLGGRAAAAPLAGADSLRIMALASALRLEFGAPVGVAALMQACSAGADLAGLGELVDEAASSAEPAAARPGAAACAAAADTARGAGRSRTVWMGAQLYEAPMHWTLEASEAVDAAALRRALLLSSLLLL